MTSSAIQAESTVREIRQFVSNWYDALDRHVGWPEVKTYLDQDISFTFPEVTVTTHDGLRDWYHTVTRKFFDEAHRVDVADVDLNGDTARVHVVVNWRTRVWDPPNARSQQLEYEADQDWVVAVGADGRPRLRSYVVNKLTPQGDTPELT